MNWHYILFILEVLKWVALALSPVLLILARDGFKFGQDLVLAFKDGKLTDEEVVILHDDLSHIYKSISNIVEIIEDFGLEI